MMPPRAPSTSMTTGILTTTSLTASVNCPQNAQYESCACPASCENPKPSCEPSCAAGCVCDPGFMFNDSRCISASSCSCFYSSNYYKDVTAAGPAVGWSVICLSVGNTVCQLKNSQYGCHSYGTATCFVFGDPHYLTFDGRHFSFMGKCTYILAQSCGSSTELFFRVAVKNEVRGQEGVSCVSKVFVTLPQTTVTLLKDRHRLVKGQQVTLPAMPSKGVLLAATPTPGNCGFCGSYDGDLSNDNLKLDGSPAEDVLELGSSWQTAEDEDKECQNNQANPPSGDPALQSLLSEPEFCGRLVDPHGAFEACLPHLMGPTFFKICITDMCNFQGLQSVLCAHMAALTETCQDAGYIVKSWRGPQFCPLACPANSKYAVCAKPCPSTRHSGFSGMSCPERCVEGCECNPGFVLSGLECVPPSQCGCFEYTVGYLKTGQQWFRPGCQQLCICEYSQQDLVCALEVPGPGGLWSAGWHIRLPFPSCFSEAGKSFRCLGSRVPVADTWKSCDILMNPVGPFFQCHREVAPHSSFTSCVYGQCGSKGNALTLCRSLQAYVAQCALASWAPSWRNSTFCPLKCPSGSSYSPCANPCPATCCTLDSPTDCPAALHCVEDCKCQKSHVLSGMSCVSLSQLGRAGTQIPSAPGCAPAPQITSPASRQPASLATWMGMCRISKGTHYVSFDGSYHAIRGSCTYVLVKVCHSTSDLPFFTISGKKRKPQSKSSTPYVQQLNIDISCSWVTLQRSHHVLINGTQVTLPSKNQIQGVRIAASGVYTVLSILTGVELKSDGHGCLEIEIPKASYEKVCGICGNFNGEEEDEMMIPMTSYPRMMPNLWTVGETRHLAQTINKTTGRSKQYSQ
ncbi:Zonadhesin [Manis pentadactyla]|nr:Zonadhesin [Manis pentadactyla]